MPTKRGYDIYKFWPRSTHVPMRSASICTLCSWIVWHSDTFLYVPLRKTQWKQHSCMIFSNSEHVPLTFLCVLPVFVHCVHELYYVLIRSYTFHFVKLNENNTRVWYFQILNTFHWRSYAFRQGFRIVFYNCYTFLYVPIRSKQTLREIDFFFIRSCIRSKSS